MIFRRRRLKKELNEKQTANRFVNKLLTYGLLAFLVYSFLYHPKKPELKHFSFTKENYTPVQLPSILIIKNQGDDSENYYPLPQNRLVDLAPKESDGNYQLIYVK